MANVSRTRGLHALGLGVVRARVRVRVRVRVGPNPNPSPNQVTNTSGLHAYNLCLFSTFYHSFCNRVRVRVRV